ncbi:hypothetical protein [Allorhodopirellula solitaria]|uniref:Uncharacterized protein n=1 Tax=Allorhodopirellula solitaria TaxID=2527987 RepID=A0A5C5YEE0_9BACT|nr:hypothetical protein [Allorhodopirellula solitaria]TWT73299.1 hypothetical protein CA85_17670 [Allorhodopirellula solitaria]
MAHLAIVEVSGCVLEATVSPKVNHADLTREVPDSPLVCSCGMLSIQPLKSASSRSLLGSGNAQKSSTGSEVREVNDLDSYKQPVCSNDAIHQWETIDFEGMAKEKNEKADSVMLPGVYRQLDLQCNARDISDLLEKIQERSTDARKALRRSGSKRDVILNLKHAIDSRYAEFSEVVDLLQKGEESGHQSIFLFKARTEAVRTRLRSGSEIAERLFGEDWGDDFFPLFERPIKGMQWVDCRLGLAGKPRDWLLKAYGHDQREETTDNKFGERLGDGLFQDRRLYRVRDINTVMVVRWRDPEYLEIRVDKSLARNFSDTLARLGTVAELLRPAVDVKSELVKLSMRARVTALARDRREFGSGKSGKSRVYRLGRMTVLDGVLEGAVEFRPGSDDDSIDEDHAMAASLDALLEQGGMSDRTPIEWLAPEKSIERYVPLRTVVEGPSLNVVTVQSRVSPEALDYVLEKLTSNS